MDYLENNINRIRQIVLEVLNHKDNLNIQLHGGGGGLSPTRNSKLIIHAILGSKASDENILFRVNKMHPDGHKDSAAYLCINMYQQNLIVETGFKHASPRQIKINKYSEYLANLSNYTAQLKKYADNPKSIYESGVSI
jgi:hypothetical protein